MNSKLTPLVIVGVVALLVGLFGGYYYEKTKLTAMMASQDRNFQMQLDEAKKTGSSGNTAMGSDAVMMANNANLGNYVTASNGMTLYTFDKDSANVSNCTGQCLVNWPPFLVSGEVPSKLPDHLGTFVRADGSKQYTWNSLPLYFYAGDKNKGDVNGDGVGGTWHVAK